MSEKQAQAAVIETINDLTDREKYGGEWKLYDREKPVDVNTLPAPTNNNCTEMYIEAMVLAGLVTEMMNEENNEKAVT